jgi:hypothetical protein
MARGHRDWFIETGAYAFGDIDVAEAMVRLGSPNVYRRSGRVIYLDSFECGVGGWQYFDPAGTTGKVESIASQPISGDNQLIIHGRRCAKITPSATGDANGEWRTHMIKRLPRIWNGDLGIEALIASSPSAKAITLGLGLWDGPTYAPAEVTVDLANQDLLYRSAVSGAFAAIYTKAADLEYGELRMAGERPWAYLKLVVSSDLTKYRYALWNQQEIDLSGLVIPSVAPGSAFFAHLGVTVIAWGSTNAQQPAYVDALVVTQDEP